MKIPFTKREIIAWRSEFILGLGVELYGYAEGERQFSITLGHRIIEINPIP